MALMRREELPARQRWGEVDDFRRRFLPMFDEPFRFPLFQSPAGYMPAVEITDVDSDLVVTAELPGMKKEDIEVQLEDNVLTLRGEKKEEHEEKEKEQFLVERSYGMFQRTFTLPVRVKEEEVKAEFADGVLKIRLPKAGESSAKRITING